MIIANINGYETPIDIRLPEVDIVGDKSSYKITNGRLVEMGGIAEVEATTVKRGVIEGTKDIELNLTTLLDVQVSALDVVDSPENCTGESAHFEITETGIRVYATASATSTKTMSVKWSVKGVA